MAQNNAGIGWFIAGAAIGAGIGLLCAPAAGAKTRNKLAEKTRGSGEALAEGGRELFERGRELYERGRHIADEATVMFEKGRELYERGRQIAEEAAGMFDRGRRATEESGGG